MYSQIRLLFKQIAKINAKQPNIANHFKQIIKTHHHSHQKLPSHVNKIKFNTKMSILTNSLTNLFKNTQSQNAFLKFSSQMKLIQIYTGINIYVDRFCFFKKQRTSKQQQLLVTFPQYLKLTTQKQKQFVKNVIKKLFKGQELYPYQDIAAFLADSRSSPCEKRGLQALNQLQLQQLNYVKQIMSDRHKIRISNQFRDIYMTIFTQKPKKTYFQQTLQSYLSSNFILIDFQNDQKKNKK